MNYSFGVAAALLFGFILGDLFIAIVGYAISVTKQYHRLGLRLMAMSLWSAWILPYLCSCDCDGSCGNWTCPNYHK